MTSPECADFGTIEHEGGQNIYPFCAMGAALRGAPLDASRIHPALMSSQERLRLADALLRDDLTKEQREAASKVIYYQEAKLTMVRAAVE